MFHILEVGWKLYSAIVHPPDVNQKRGMGNAATEEVHGTSTYGNSIASILYMPQNAMWERNSKWKKISGWMNPLRAHRMNCTTPISANLEYDVTAFITYFPIFITCQKEKYWRRILFPWHSAQKGNLMISEYVDIHYGSGPASISIQEQWKNGHADSQIQLKPKEM